MDEVNFSEYFVKNFLENALHLGFIFFLWIDLEYFLKADWTIYRFFCSFVIFFKLFIMDAFCRTFFENIVFVMLEH